MIDLICGDEWKNQIDSKIDPTLFGSEFLIKGNPYQQSIDALHMIIEQFGIEIYAEEKRLYSLLNDIIPNTSKEKNILKTVISFGVPQLILSIVTDSFDRTEILKRTYELMIHGGLSEDWCAASLYILANPLNIYTTDIYPIKTKNNKISFDIKCYDEKKEKEYCKKTLDDLINMAVNGDAIAATELGERYYWGRGIDKDLDVAVAYFTKAADAEYPVAEFILGNLYDEGQCVPHDSVKAVEYYQKSANKSYPSAQYSLGQMYYYGQGCEKDDSKALYWILKAADELEDSDLYIMLATIYSDSSDDSIRDETKAFTYAHKASEMENENAYYLLGIFYEMGVGVSKSYEKAFQYYKLAVDNGVELAYLSIGSFYQNGIVVSKDERRATEYYQYGAYGGDMYCLNALGMCYRNGIGVLQDDIKAFDLFLEAAYAGNVAGEVNVGIAYDEGRGVLENKIEAKKWFELGAKHGNSWAMVYLGFYKEKGILDGESNLREAFKWYLKAAEVGDHPVITWIVGNCYSEGLMGVEVDLCIAFEWYLKAAELGHATAQNNVACYYVNGEIVNLDYQLAIDWFEKAVKQEDMYALNNYGILMLKGDGIPQDIKRAFLMIKKSAVMGNPEAQYNLGVCYFEGWGTSRNIDEALKWLVLAENAGSSNAKKYLAKEFKNKNGIWVKRGIFRYVSAQKSLPIGKEPLKCKGGCVDICKYANINKAEELYEGDKFCFCELIKAKVFRKSKCPYYQDGLRDLLKPFIHTN